MTRHVWIIGLAALTAACGNNVEQSAASGGLGGAAVGALVGGPVGAVVGAGIGAGAGTGVEYAQRNDVLDKMTQEGGDQSQAQASGPTNEEVRRAQMALQQQGLYNGPIDGIAGPITRDGVAQFQQRQGLPQTAQLDDLTIDALVGGEQAQTAEVPPTRRQPAPPAPPPPAPR
ncbi:MAG TPA: peptidoglycan-binding domain-containing protein [Candidatus Omnitrophota bacterium]|nr:peptidoglycan-binding domain-containing protein [Candidatus Omnitrophota bacterium]